MTGEFNIVNAAAAIAIARNGRGGRAGKQSGHARRAERGRCPVAWSASGAATICWSMSISRKLYFRQIAGR